MDPKETVRSTFDEPASPGKQNTPKIVTDLRKRDGRIVPFEVGKIEEAIFKAAQAVGGNDRQLAKELAEKVTYLAEQTFPGRVPGVEEVQDLVEKTLIKEGHAKTAKAYILYRHKKSLEREQRAFILGEKQAETDVKFSPRALKVLRQRYLRKDEQGEVVETPDEMLRRVAKAVAQADASAGASSIAVQQIEETFYELLSELRFLPNSPTLMNAGTKMQQLSACFVLPIEDTLESIFTTLRDATLIHQRGSGTGFSFSRLRPAGDHVKASFGVAAGPVAFLQAYDATLDVVKQGGVRPGANMAVLRVDHPDIIRFIEAKAAQKILKNFNLSVGVTDAFMRAVEQDQLYTLRNPRTYRVGNQLRAKEVFSLLTQNAWRTGDPGILFLDEINRQHPAPHLGEIETTNQCGEAPLLPYEGCMLGSVNLLRCLTADGLALDWELLRQTVKMAVHFLDNAIDVQTYLTPIIEETTKKTRKFGLGIMGLAELFFTLGVKYDSEEGLTLAEKIMALVREAAYGASQELAEKKGTCPAWPGSEHWKVGRKMRNMTCLSIAPTGTISLLADTSGGCEPLFALSYQQTMLGGETSVYLNTIFVQVAKEQGFALPELFREVAQHGSVQHISSVPEEVRRVFVTARDISPLWHIRMQAALQKHVDNSISKTINFPKTATIRDVEEAYMLAWKMGCKGLTIYRDGSMDEQVLQVGER